MASPTKDLLKPAQDTIKKRRQTAQAILRAEMEKAAPDIITLFKKAILLGEIDGKAITTKSRTDLLKAYMPFVLPQLKSIEITSNEAKEIQPLIINMHGGGDVHVDAAGTGIEQDTDIGEAVYEEVPDTGADSTPPQGTSTDSTTGAPLDPSHNTNIDSTDTSHTDGTHETSDETTTIESTDTGSGYLAFDGKAF